jgi:alkylation response protein AidB-like acyl-CoA dehydrogenase
MNAAARSRPTLGPAGRQERGQVTHYRSNLRDIEFNLFEVFGVASVMGTGPFSEIDSATAREILREIDRLAREDVAASFAATDRNPPTYDPETKSVTMPPAFARSYHAYMDAEWFRLQLPTGLGGQLAPAPMIWSMAEMILGANPAVWMYACGPNMANVIYVNGTKRDQRIARHIIERKWGVTMVLTEPDAGSDVGCARTRAARQPDGSWHLTGVKRFITSAEHDLADNIVHLVLARPVGVPGVGGPGTKGLSLFIVPKYGFDRETGEVDRSDRNGVYATNLEKKLGLRSSTTCELTFGDDAPARGWLLGEVHDGIAQMFQVIESARMMVGTKAMATLSTGYLNALDYAKARVQGPDLARASDKSSPRVPITHHPDVRRSLLTQKGYAEGLRALIHYAATFQDRLTVARADGSTDDLASAVNDLLLPIVKGYGSERAWVQLGTETLQTFGGCGFLEDYPIEQYLRDSKIDTLYEGTTAIQGLDLFFRKVVRNHGVAVGYLAAEMHAFVDGEHGNGRLKVERELLGRALTDVQAMVDHLLALAESSVTPGGEVTNVYKVGLNTTRLLTSLGDLVCSWLLLRQAEVALAALQRPVSAADRAFYTGKVTGAQFFTRTVLPHLSAERAVVEGTDLIAMDLDEAGF